MKTSQTFPTLVTPDDSKESKEVKEFKSTNLPTETNDELKISLTQAPLLTRCSLETALSPTGESPNNTLTSSQLPPPPTNLWVGYQASSRTTHGFLNYNHRQASTTASPKRDNSSDDPTAGFDGPGSP